MNINGENSIQSAYGRRRGTAIINTEKGIIVVAERNSKFLLPGGGTRPHEMQIESAIREVKEELGVYPVEVKFLFRYMAAKVFFMKVVGTPIPHNEISRIGYYNPSCNLEVSNNTKKILDIYYGSYMAP
ncbi:ADP-ribose pyrophosphatase [Methanomethylovorans hollandica DSM 15978]|uniref:ADP-ribose pyrophosphatase n=1 Tax=Methanomethylovorans hollandica (strain DSM 15978 / NBRC 107637 / DMS1) TaxID=867904 RepID=L0KUR9_METHD|nr:NUDIX hydrolase [Methanomethylovorans hollandica]AGB49197.1 ADP-ribose pyrophosphatase [Methanomethylovorans hollandica DSM 15978]